MPRQRELPKVGRLRRRRRSVAGIAVVAAAVVLGACATDSQPGRAARTGPVIVASTDVYGAIAHAVAGDHAEITSIIDKAKGDPHDYEASTRDILAVSRADIVIENGGGYDDFMHTLRDAADNRDARVLDAVEITGRHANDDAVNEHVWYDLASMSLLAERLRDALAAVDPARAADYRANTAAFVGDVSKLEDRAVRIGEAHPGASAAVTEPVPLDLLATIGIQNRMPEAFSEAVEEGEEASPSVLAHTLALFTHDRVGLLVVNAQTTDEQTDQLVAAANAHRVPIVSVTETLPKGETYTSWMSTNLDAIADALDRHPSRPGS